MRRNDVWKTGSSRLCGAQTHDAAPHAVKMHDLSARCLNEFPEAPSRRRPVCGCEDMECHPIGFETRLQLCTLRSLVRTRPANDADPRATSYLMPGELDDHGRRSTTFRLQVFDDMQDRSTRHWNVH